MATKSASQAQHGAGPQIRLAALVVTYQRLSQIRATVERLLATPVARVLVVDNGSTDGTRAWLASVADPRLKVILAETNLGGAGGFEAGLRELVATDDPDWIVLMDDDARPLSGTIERFLDHGPWSFDAVSAAVYLADGSICEMNRPTVNPFWNMGTFVKTTLGMIAGRSRESFHVPDSAYRVPDHKDIDATSFVGLFLARETIRRGGYPDGRLFIYGDDVLYTLSLRKRGMRIGFVPDLTFEHDDHPAWRDGVVRYVPVWKTYYNARNGLRVYRSAAGLMFLPAMAIVLAKWLLAGRHYGADKRAYYRLLWHGLRDGMLGRLSRPHSEVTGLARLR
ncbi:MAG: glycosyltransferase [Pseudomonadota bacterium]